GAGVGHDGVFRSRRADRVREHRAHLYLAIERAHRSVHHWEIRMNETHRHFHDELSQVKIRLLTMSGEDEAALGLAVEALLERDADKAQRVIDGDRVLDLMEVEI